MSIAGPEFLYSFLFRTARHFGNAMAAGKTENTAERVIVARDQENNIPAVSEAVCYEMHLDAVLEHLLH